MLLFPLYKRLSYNSSFYCAFVFFFQFSCSVLCALLDLSFIHSPPPAAVSIYLFLSLQKRIVFCVTQASFF